MRACLVTVLLGFAGLCWNTSPAQSQPLRTALIISNAQYANLPPLARCTASAAAVRDALKAKGFEVVERSDVRRGEFDAAIGSLAKRTAASPPSVAVVYYCGYAQEFNGRSFLLPAAADIPRENDVLTQGLISKSLVDSLARVGDSTGVVLLDGFQPPGTQATGLARLAEQIQPGSFAVIGANNDAAAQGPTATAQALRGQLDGRRGQPREVRRRHAGRARQERRRYGLLRCRDRSPFVPGRRQAAAHAGRCRRRRLRRRPRHRRHQPQRRPPVHRRPRRRRQRRRNR